MTKLDELRDTMPWEWPDDARDTLLAALRDPNANADDLDTAVEIAGDPVIIDDDLADGLLATARRTDVDPEVRARAALSIGPALESAWNEEDDTLGEPAVSGLTAQRLGQALHALYEDTGIPDVVRRASLEAAAQGPGEWQAEAVRAAYASNDDEWQLSSVFCMRFIPGFDDEILESLASLNPGVQYEAVCAAGDRALDEAWDAVAELLHSDEIDKALLLAAIEALASIRPQQAEEELGFLLDSDDEEVVETACAAIGLAQTLEGLENEDDDEE